MAYNDKSMVAARHIGRTNRFHHTGIGPYRDVTAALTGTHLTTPTEAEVIAGTQTIIITLTNGNWLPAGTAFNASRQLIIDGLNSTGSESTGWNTLVRDVMAVTAVARTSASIVTITLPATPAYKIDENETIEFTIPPQAVQRIGSNQAVLPSFTEVASNPTVTAALTGTFLTTPTEGEVVSGGQTIIITLTGGEWIDTAGFNAVRQGIIDGMTSDGSEETGWNVLVRDVIAVTTVVRTSATIVTVTLPAIGSYSIDSAEEVTVTIPKEAIELVSEDVIAGDTIDIQPDA